MALEKCGTVQEALDSMDTLEELEAFTAIILNPPAGVTTKQPTQAEWDQIARLKIRMRQNGGRR